MFRYNHFWKPVLSWCIAAFLWLLLMPCLCLLGVVMLAVQGYPVFFVQPRSGKNGRPFLLYKFRTMQVAQNSIQATDKQRITSLGKWLRRYSLDELPQLWNVLKGDMSLVGPRPLPQAYAALYNDFQRQRLQVKPGITGWAQVNGRNQLTWTQKFAYDVYYVQNLSWQLDVKILLLTFQKVITGHGVDAHKDQTMEVFKGNT
jgi:lipopolysaccharide/colanic/teichoic acid biosynthesis glycosyltransferase